MNFFNNCNVTLSITSLIKLTLNYKSSSDDYAPVCTLAIKGLDKFRNFLYKLNTILDMNKLFETIYLFFSEFEKTNENLIPHNINEENALNIINSIISEFVKIYGDRIWGLYNTSLNDNLKRMDIYLKRSIEINLKEYKKNNILINTNSLKQIANKYNFNNSTNNENNDINLINNNNKIEDKNDVMYFINRLKERGLIMTEEEKNNCYNEIVSLLRQKNEPITSISTKLEKEYYGKIYELYHSFSSKKPGNNTKSLYKTQISLSNEEKEKTDDKKLKSPEYTLTEQAKRIQEYKNKFNSLTDRTNLDNSSDIFSNKDNNFNFKGKINDENNQLNGENESKGNRNILFDLENRKRQLDELSKGNVINSKSMFNSQSDIPVMNSSYLTGNVFGNQNNYSNLSFKNDNGFMSQNSKNNELVNIMKKIWII